MNPAPFGAMNKHRILIVDDEPNLSRLLAAHLEKSGSYQIVTENRSYAAMSVARSFRPDLVFLDVDMPGKDGGEVAAEIKADPGLANTKIVFLTSLISPSETKDKVVMRGGFPFLSKPATPEVVDRTLREMLGNPVSSAA